MAVVRQRLRPSPAECSPASRETIELRLIRGGEMARHPDRVGFEHPILAKRALRHRRIALAELVATVALVISILVAVTVVSIGIARADTPISAGDEGRLALAVFIGLLIAGMGGITALVARYDSNRHD
jgi:hypothetical protein